MPLEESTIFGQNLDTFISMIIDTKSNMVGENQIKLSGFSESAKEQAAFQEAAFVSELSGFLQEQDIRASEIIFEKEIMTSAENVTSYLLKISGKEELHLVAFFFPNLPGQYLFTILEKESQESEEGEVQSQVMQVEVPVPVQTESVSNVNPYDASTLTIAGIPEKLLNLKEPLVALDIMFSAKGVLVDLDEEWVMLEVEGKKKKVVKMFRIDNISSIKEIL